MPINAPSLDQQQAAFIRNRFLAMPIAGTIAWAAIGVASVFLPNDMARAWSVFIGTGMIFYLGLGVARFTGEDLMGKKSQSPFFDRVFFAAVAMAIAVYAIAIPFFKVEPTSLPLSVGILAGLMWIPFSALVGHWIGYFHAGARTVLIVAAHYLFPTQRFLVIPIVIVAVYLVTVLVLEKRFVAANAMQPRTAT
jgi:hypothetical protein